MSDDLPLIGVIARLEMKPGDILLIQSRRPISEQTASRVRAIFEPLLPHKNEVVIVGDLDISVISPSIVDTDDEAVDPTTSDLLKPTGNDGIVNAEICFNALLLVGLDLPERRLPAVESEVAKWTQSQLDQAYDWAMRIHLHASDNPGVLVPKRPDFILPAWRMP